ncbi:hypothetical protein HPB51_013982 [Rhipicephalus microplus]|uniref:Uncharacterized protein n=1 Tax=Rhipicephalus microplus TaxID=6941 RepID=A0A9J6D9W2_RHIMP|nr:hypothetical protein HPB51_013982 [Rhipicephalus microplus]
MAENSCLKIVSAALERNCTLQMMCMNYSATSLPALEIWQRLRRNMGMMMQAIEFALTRNVSKALAEAFEMCKDTSFFLQELAKSNGNQVDYLYVDMTYDTSRRLIEAKVV